MLNSVLFNFTGNFCFFNRITFLTCNSENKEWEHYFSENILHVTRNPNHSVGNETVFYIELCTSNLNLIKLLQTF